ncbi:MAG: hypothetical protein U0798_15735 [Gemmataceae bacterium]
MMTLLVWLKLRVPFPHGVRVTSFTRWQAFFNEKIGKIVKFPQVVAAQSRRGGDYLIEGDSRGDRA